MTDFGFAKKLNAEKTYTICGTPEYYAPEMLAEGDRKAGYGKSVDWWALGVTIFQMLVGETPFDDEDPMQILENIKAAKFKFPKNKKKNIDAKAKDIVIKLLRPNPQKRLGVNDNGQSIMNH